MSGKAFLKAARLAAPMTIACGFLAVTSVARAQSDDSQSAARRCSNRTLAGAYGSTSEGVLLPAPFLSLPFRSLTRTHFDGSGKLRWVEHTVINGAPAAPGWTAATGTYAVQPNCTGTAVVNTPNSPVPLHLAFVVVKNGGEIRAVLDSNAISTTFVKIEEDSRDLSSKGKQN